MSDTINFSTFPSGKIQALTMLYLKTQFTGECEPEELARKYDEVYNRINDEFKSINEEKRYSNR